MGRNVAREVVKKATRIERINVRCVFSFLSLGEWVPVLDLAKRKARPMSRSMFICSIQHCVQSHA